MLLRDAESELHVCILDVVSPTWRMPQITALLGKALFKLIVSQYVHKFYRAPWIVRSQKIKIGVALAVLHESALSCPRSSAAMAPRQC